MPIARADSRTGWGTEPSPANVACSTGSTPKIDKAISAGFKKCSVQSIHPFWVQVNFNNLELGAYGEFKPTTESKSL
jgi:hypothetical protein